MDRPISPSRAARCSRRRPLIVGQRLPWLAVALAVALAACAGRSDFDDEAALSIRDEAATDESGETVLGRALMRQARDELAVLSQPASKMSPPSSGSSQPAAGTSQPSAGTAQSAAGTSQPTAGMSQSTWGTSPQAPIVSRAPRSLAAETASASPASDIALSAAAASQVDPTPAPDRSPSATDSATDAAGAEGDQAERPNLFRRLFGWLRARGASGDSAEVAAGTGAGGAGATAAAADSASATAGTAASGARETAVVAETPRVVAPELAVDPRATTQPRFDGTPAAPPVDPRAQVEPASPVATPVPDRTSIASISVPMTTDGSSPVTRTMPANAPTLTAALRSDISSSPATDVEPLGADTLARGNFATLMGAMYGMVERCDSQTMMRDQALKSFRATYPLIDLDRREINDTELRQRADGDFERSVAAARSGGTVNCDYVRSQSYRWNELATDLRRMNRQSALQYRQGLITEIRRGAGIGGFN
ncbi:MAG: hypothetical protein ABWZ78_13085 [Burkholderiaceae bacterium]